MVEADAPGFWHAGQARRQDPALEWDRFLLEAREQLADVVGGDEEGGHACRHLLVQAQQLSQTLCKMPGEDLGHGADVQDVSKCGMPCPVSAGLAPQQPEFRDGPHHSLEVREIAGSERLRLRLFLPPLSMSLDARDARKFIMHHS